MITKIIRVIVDTTEEDLNELQVQFNLEKGGNYKTCKMEILGLCKDCKHSEKAIISTLSNIDPWVLMCKNKNLKGGIVPPEHFCGYFKQSK